VSVSPMHISYEEVIRRSIELYLAKKIAEYAGELTGAQVVRIHKCVVEKLCADKHGWAALECIVDKMDEVYRKVKEVGFDQAMREYTCG